MGLGTKSREAGSSPKLLITQTLNKPGLKYPVLLAKESICEQNLQAGREQACILHLGLRKEKEQLELP